MADVWCAEDSLLNRRVALKFLHPRFAQDEQFVERFRREASAAAGLQHPNVVGVFDRGTVDGAHFIAMEYVEGASLKDLIERGLSVPRGGRDRPPGAGGSEVRARARHRPPRPEAPERAGRLRGARARHRLRHRPRRGVGDHPDRVGAGHGAVPVAGAGAGPSRDRGVGHLLGRRDALRGSHRAGAVRRRLPGDGRAQAGLRAPAPAERAEPRGLARARRSGPARPGEGPGEPVRLRRGVPPGPRRRREGSVGRRLRRHRLLRGRRRRGRDRAAAPAGGASGGKAVLHAGAHRAAGAAPPAPRGSRSPSSSCAAEGRRTSSCQLCSASRRTRRRRSSPTPGSRCPRRRFREPTRPSAG